MSGNQNFDRNAAKHIAGGNKGADARPTSDDKPNVIGKPLTPQKLDPNKLGSVSGGFKVNEIKVDASTAKPLVPGSSIGDTKPTK